VTLPSEIVKLLKGAASELVSLVEALESHVVATSAIPSQSAPGGDEVAPSEGPHGGPPKVATELVEIIVEPLLYPTQTTTLHLTIKDETMANYQLNAGDSVVVTLTDTDDVTGLAVPTDAGSVTVVLSNISDSVVVDPSGTFLTITGGPLNNGNTVTVNAKVNGVASKPFVGTYDVVASAPVTSSTTLTGTFGVETGPNPPFPGVASPYEYPTGTPTTAAQLAALATNPAAPADTRPLGLQ